MNYIVELNTLTATIKFCFGNKLDAMQFLTTAFDANDDANEDLIVKFSIYKEMP